MLGGRSWDEWIARYGQSHRHPVNRFCHTVGIPLIVLSLPLVGGGVSAQIREPRSQPASSSIESCFLLFELGVGEVRRGPADACRTRITPASTFKVPHALAALDSGVISGPDDKLAYDGSGQWPESARRDHTLASAMQNSVVWYFQRIAQRLGPDREQAYLKRLIYGNMDSSSGLTNVLDWCVIGPQELEANAAIDLAARSLRDARVL